MEKMYDVGDVFYATGDSCVSYYDRITNVISRVVEMGNVPFCIGGRPLDNLSHIEGH